MAFVKKNSTLLLSILLLTITVTVFGPIELYFTNYEEFWFTPIDTLIIIAILLVAGGTVFTGAGFLLRGKARDLYGCILFIAGVVLYIQGNYININYGVLNGEEIDWSVYTVYAVLNTLGWMLFVGIAIFMWIHKRNLFHKIQKYVSLWILAIQLVTIITLFVTTEVSDMEKSGYYLSDEGIYEVSSKENIIIFILDEFDDVYFQEFLKEEPEKCKNIFEDFTHFNNASAGGASTKIGMPAIITGEHYPGGISYQEYIKQSFNRDKLYSTLQDKNYDVRIYSNSNFVPDESSELLNNQVATGYVVTSYPKLAEKYFSLTLYKYMPHILKRYFWIYTGEFDQYKAGSSVEGFVADDAAYFQKLQDEKLQINKEKNIFRIIYMNGAHPPYILDEYAQRIDSEDSSAFLQAKGALYIVENYINQLKELELYDDSTIMVMADHGDAHANETRGKQQEHGILLVKNRKQKGEFTESDAPVSYYDLHATLFRELGIDAGETFFEITESERQRYFYKNETDAGAMKVVEYVIDGNLNCDNVISQTGKVLMPSRTKELYKYGTHLTFGADNTMFPYVVYGVSSTDMGDSSWTDGKAFELEFDLEKAPEKNLLITMDIKNIYSGNGSQKVICYANDIECYEEMLSGGKMLQFVIPGTAVQKDKKLVLRTELPNAVSPAELFGEGQDTRVLGLDIQGFWIDETEEAPNVLLEVINKYVFGNKGNVEAYLLGGWHQPESGHNWTTSYAEILIRTDKVCNYIVSLHFYKYAPSGDTTIFVNDTPLGIMSGDETTADLKIPADLLNESGYQILAFSTQNAVSPSERGESDDPRELGICLYTMDVIPDEE